MTTARNERGWIESGLVVLATLALAAAAGLAVWILFDPDVAKDLTQGTELTHKSGWGIAAVVLAVIGLAAALISFRRAASRPVRIVGSGVLALSVPILVVSIFAMLFS